MAKYRISGLWRVTNNIITHYTFHTINETSTTRASKKSKADIVTIKNNRNQK